MDRREFLAVTGAAGATLALSLPAAAQAPPPRPRRARSIYVDAQGSLNGFDEPEPGRFVPGPRVIEAIRERRIDIISATVAPGGNGADRFQGAVGGIAEWDQLIGAHPQLLAKIESAADIRAAREADKLGLVYNFQDTTPLEADADRVDTFATLGVKVIQLTYNKRNLAGDGCLERSNAGSPTSDAR